MCACSLCVDSEAADVIVCCGHPRCLSQYLYIHGVCVRASLNASADMDVPMYVGVGRLCKQVQVSSLSEKPLQGTG